MGSRCVANHNIYLGSLAQVGGRKKENQDSEKLGFLLIECHHGLLADVTVNVQSDFREREITVSNWRGGCDCFYNIL